MATVSVMETQTEEAFHALSKLRKDLRTAAETLGAQEARFLVDHYYIVQEGRKRSANQIRQMDEEPHLVVKWFFDNSAVLERNIQSALDVWTSSFLLGRWAKSIHGIGPVLSAGLAAHVDVRIANTAGKLWSFAGLDPRAVWKKGEKRPWNATLKTICWKIGDSFVKQSGNEKCFYGKVYRKRKELEVSRNEEGLLKDQAEDKLKNFKIGKTTEAYKWYIQGKLPPGRLDLRARRVAVKLFLSHYQHVAYEIEFGEEPPEPYVFVHKDGHGDYIPPPNWPMK